MPPLMRGPVGMKLFLWMPVTALVLLPVSLKVDRLLQVSCTWCLCGIHCLSIRVSYLGEFLAHSTQLDLASPFSFN